MLSATSQPKYFFVGLTATGNYTAARAMQMLGYRACHFPLHPGWASYFDVMTDTPVAMWFRQELLPKDATYVLTVRALDSWLETCQTWFESRPLDTLDPVSQELRWFLYGGLTFDRKRFIAAYHNHVESCDRLASLHGLKLYEWNVMVNPSWEFLCSLTGRPRPPQPFPLQTEKSFKRATWQGAIEAAQNR